MPHAALKLIPGVDQNKTLALNEAAISNTNLVRFIPDRQGIGLVQKLGGWTKFFSGSIGSIVRALWAWEDINARSWLGVGATESLNLIQGGSLQVITPQTTTVNIAASATTTINQSNVTITATGSGLGAYDVVDIRTQISVGGLILFGQYPVTPVNTNQFQITAVDVLGNPAYATSSVTAAGDLALFNTTSGSSSIKVTLNGHGLQGGDTFPILAPTIIGGVTLSGNYTVLSYPAPTANDFYIGAASAATSTTSGNMNGNNAQYVYYIGVGPAAANAGYGVGGYGSGGYGSGVVSPVNAGTPIVAADWTLDNWGEVLMSCPLNGPIYSWSPSNNSPIASIVVNSPIINSGMLVAMPQRQLIAWGSTSNGVQDLLLIRWCDADNYNSWIPLVTNQAGSFRIPKGSRIVQCIQGPQQTLVWTDLSIWAMQYVGPPYVYQFNEIGTGCGLIGRRAAGSMGGVVYWMGQSQFYRLAGGGVEPIRCPVWDVIFQDLDKDYKDYIRVAPNSRFGEISWYYPTIKTLDVMGASGNGATVTLTYDTDDVYIVGSSITVTGVNPIGYNGTYVVTASSPGRVSFASTTTSAYVSGGSMNGHFEPNAYAKYNIILDQWDFGQLGRTAWINESVLGPPVGAAPNFYIYQHETSTDADGQAMDSYFQTGYFAMTEADIKIFVDQIWPDMKWGYYGGTQNAQLLISFYVADYPGQTPIVYGPFTMTEATTFITPRFRGRLTSIKVESNDVGSWWRIGNIRYRLQQDGRF
jgi:hypothetical protein